MKRSRFAGLVVAASALTLSLGACASGPVTPSSPPPGAQMQGGDSAQPPLLGILQAIEPRSTQPAMSKTSLREALGLTGEQIAQFKAIKAKYRTPAQKAEMQAKLQQLEGLLSAPTLDRGALDSFVTSMEGWIESKLPRCAAALGEAREVLSADQRSQVVELIDSHRSHLNEMLEAKFQKKKAKLTTDLSLTPSQVADLEAIWTQLKPLKVTQAGTLLEALSAFMANGDQSAFVDAIRPLIGQTPHGPGLDWLETLSLTQRQSLANKLESYHQEHMAEHGMD